MNRKPDCRRIFSKMQYITLLTRGLAAHRLANREGGRTVGSGRVATIIGQLNTF